MRIPACALAALFLLLPNPAPSVAQSVQKILAPDGENDDRFGWGLAVDGDLLVAGSRFDDDRGANAGAVYLYRFDGSEWAFEQKIVAINATAGGSFGTTVGVLDEELLVAVSSGPAGTPWRAYVYRFDGTAWNHQQNFTPNDAKPEDQFGVALAVGPDVIAFGAPGDTGLGPNVGSVRVYRFQDFIWREEQILTAPDAGSEQRFGSAVAFAGDMLIAGSRADDFDGTFNRGSAHVFRYDGAAWNHQQKLTASDGVGEDYFGSSIDVDGDVMVIGAPHGFSASPKPGSAYVFRYDGSTWTEEQKLVPSDGAEYDAFGYSVAVQGDRVLVGARGNDELAQNSGAAYLFTFDGTEWVEEMKVTASDGISIHEFSSHVDFGGDWILIGASGDDDLGDKSGAVYAYDIGTSVARATDPALPSTPVLDQNYPNPFNPSTRIRYELPSATHVRLAVYDPLGRLVHLLADGIAPAGTHQVGFDASGLPSGVYVYRLDTASGSVSRRMALMQ